MKCLKNTMIYYEYSQNEICTANTKGFLLKDNGVFFHNY